MNGIDIIMSTAQVLFIISLLIQLSRTIRMQDATAISYIMGIGTGTAIGIMSGCMFYLWLPITASACLFQCFAWYFLIYLKYKYAKNKN
jgi:hypothetical protein